MKIVKMDLLFFKFSFVLSALALLLSCSSEKVRTSNSMEVEHELTDEKLEPMEKDSNAIYYAGDVIINDTITTDSSQKIIIQPGTNITFGPNGILVANGDVIIKGTLSNPIYITGSQERISHRVIQVRWDAKEFILNNTIVEDGLITSVAEWNHISDATFVNNKVLLWSDALIRFWFSSLLVENCTFVGVNQGDGILVHNMKYPIVRGCNFFQTPDAVEYINCQNGLIEDNIFHDCADDGIDQNGCFKTIIKNNEFCNVLDKAIEIGSNSFGRSDSIEVTNNLFEDCNVAVNVKQSSFVRVQNSTFYNNETVLELESDQDSLIRSSAILTSSVIVDTDSIIIKLIGPSEVNITNCMSDVDLRNGTSNMVSEIKFLDPIHYNYKILKGDFPIGYDATSIGYVRQ